MATMFMVTPIWAKTVPIHTNGSSTVTSVEKQSMKQQTAKTSKVMTIKSFDGYLLKGKLNLPIQKEPIKRIVLFVNGSGPNTYENHRNLEDLEFNYFDIFSDTLTQSGVGFFSYNTRGVDLGKEPPMYDALDEAAYKKYLPSVQVQDIECMIKALRQDDRLKNTEIYLLGWSEGTIIAPLVAERGNVKIDALLLAGYCNDTLEDILNWQLSGGSSMVFYKQYFDDDKNGVVSKEEFDRDTHKIKESFGLNTIPFKEIDLNQNGQIDENDMGTLLKQQRELTLKAFNTSDNEWLKNNYPVRLTGEWYQDHKKLKPNKETLLKLNLPIYIFQGTVDRNTPVEGTYQIEKLAKQNHKTNIKTYVFKDHDHDLNYFSYPAQGILSDGFKKLFEICIKN